MGIKISLRIWILIIFVVFSLISIMGLPPLFLKEGIVITSVDKDSSAFEQGLLSGQTITAIDSKKIDSLQDFATAMQGKYPSETSVKTIFTTDLGEITYFSKDSPNITVAEIPNSNIKTGLDLSGGARALIQAKDHKLSTSEVNDLVGVINNRLNVYGIADVKIIPVTDLSGGNFVLIEIPTTSLEKRSITVQA